MDEKDHIELRSEAFREILGEPPRWILRWGTSIMLLFFIVLILLGYFFKYPDIVTIPIKLETAKPPTKIAAPKMGNIVPTSLFPEDSIATAGTVLAHLKDGNGDIASIMALDSIIGAFEKDNAEIPNFAAMENWDLGSVYGEYFKFLQWYRGTNNTNATFKNQAFNTFDSSIKTLKNEIKNLEGQIAKKQTRLLNIPKERASLQEAYSENTKIENNIALRTLWETEISLGEDIAILNGQIAEKQREIREQEYQKLHFREGIKGDAAQRRQNISLSLNNLRTKIDEWKEKHLIRASETGKVYYKDNLKSKEYLVKEGEVIFAIVPPNAEATIEGKLYVSSSESGKVQKGQTVKIRFESFRPPEYGLLQGTIIEKANIPTNDQFFVRVTLDEGMQSSNGKTIPFEHQMQGTAQIITEEKRFIHRIFEQFFRMMQRK